MCTKLSNDQPISTAILASRDLKFQGLDLYIISMKKNICVNLLKAYFFFKIGKATHVIVETLEKNKPKEEN